MSRCASLCWEIWRIIMETRGENNPSGCRPTAILQEHVESLPLSTREHISPHADMAHTDITHKSSGQSLVVATEATKCCPRCNEICQLLASGPDVSVLTCMHMCTSIHSGVHHGALSRSSVETIIHSIFLSVLLLKDTIGQASVYI